MSLNKIMLVGEAWGEEESRLGKPFVGTSGSLLNQMLSQVGINRDECFTTNVFNFQPQPKNDVDNLCGKKEEALEGYPALRSGRYIRREFAPELSRLYREIVTEQPNIIVALGASAAWALLGTSGIKKIRGAPSILAGRAAQETGLQTKVLPTYHPANVMREWANRAIVISDLEKAKAESLFPELRRPMREIWIEPTLLDLAEFERRFIADADSLSIDIETSGEQITCVGFAPSVDRAIVVPLVDPLQSDGNYWRSLTDELVAIDFIRRWCLSTIKPLFNDKVKKGVGQNFQYDMNRLWRSLGIAVANEDDTMLLHHALQPEMEKGLGFLATIYTQELAWKFMRPKHETLKKED